MPQSPLYSRIINQSIAEQENLPKVSDADRCYCISGGLTKEMLRAAEEYDGGLVLRLLYKLGGYFRNRPD